MHASVVSCYHNFREKIEKAGVMTCVWISYASRFLIFLGYGELWRTQLLGHGSFLFYFIFLFF